MNSQPLLQFTTMRISLLSFIFLTTIRISSAQTMVSGHITTNTTWYASGNPYIVNYDVFVDHNVQLTVKPGVVVKFEQYKGIYVAGTLEAAGTADSMITLTSNALVLGNGSWAGIFFSDSSADFDFVSHEGCTLQYCLFDYAKGSIDTIMTSLFGKKFLYKSFY